MGEQQRQWVRPLSDHHMQHLPVDLGPELAQAVEAPLKCGWIKCAPIVEQTAQPPDRHALLPSGSEVRRHPGARQPVSQIPKRSTRQRESLLAQLHTCSIHASLLTPRSNGQIIPPLTRIV
jgi:hypothetical protein